MWKRVTELIWMCVCLGRERERERERERKKEREEVRVVFTRKQLFNDKVYFAWKNLMQPR